MTIDEVIARMENGGKLRWLPRPNEEELPIYDLFIDNEKLPIDVELEVHGHPRLREHSSRDMIEYEVIST